MPRVCCCCCCCCCCSCSCFSTSVLVSTHIVFASLTLNRTGELLHVYGQERKSSWTALFSRLHHNILYTASTNGILRIDMNTHVETAFKVDPHSTWYFSHAMALSPDESRLFLGCFDSNVVAAYDTSTMQLLWSRKMNRGVLSLCVVDSNLLVVVIFHPAALLDQATGELVQEYPGTEYNAYCVASLSSLFIHVDSPFHPSQPTHPCISLCCSTWGTSNPTPCICLWRCGICCRITDCSPSSMCFWRLRSRSAMSGSCSCRVCVFGERISWTVYRGRIRGRSSLSI